MEMRVGAVAVISPVGWTGGDGIEACSDDVCGHDPFAAAALARERILLKFSERAADRVVMSLGEPFVAAHQCLDADRLGRVEGRVPSGSSVSIAVCFMDPRLSGHGL